MINVKRVIPDGIIQMRAWLLAKKRFDESNRLGIIITAMENNIKVSKTELDFFQDLCMEYELALRVKGKSYYYDR